MFDVDHKGQPNACRILKSSVIRTTLGFDSKLKSAYATIVLPPGASSMTEPITKLRQQFKTDNRYPNFGPLVISLKIDGFRGIKDLSINLDHPITAFSGLNGAGKTTVGQLLVCAYRKPQTSSRANRYYIREFFPANKADPNPFANNASVTFTYQTESKKGNQEVSVYRAQQEWSGYKRQPERSCYYIGISWYVPKVERRDATIYAAKSIELRELREMPEHVKKKVSWILNVDYEDMSFQSVLHQNKEKEIGMVQKYKNKYSENNMGFGEGRVLHMVDFLETSAEQSLFVFEEPETSLHEDAQYRLARYLLDVVLRRHHQIVLSTHSSVILNSLPPESRKLLIRDRSGVHVYSQISAHHARALLSGGRFRALTIFVEDKLAKNIVSEILRQFDPKILKSVRIEDFGSDRAVKNAVELMQQMRENAIGIRDADKGENAEKGLYSFPGKRPPENEILELETVRHSISEEFGLDIEEERHNIFTEEHHDWFANIAQFVEADVEHVRNVAIRSYLTQINKEEYRHLYDAVTKSLSSS
jgi:predicted ATPase